MACLHLAESMLIASFQHYLEFVAQFFNGQMSIPKKIEKTEIVGEETHPGPVVLNIQSFATPYEGRKAQVLADIWDAICAYFNQVRIVGANQTNFISSLYRRKTRWTRLPLTFHW